MRPESETYLKSETFIMSPQTNIQILCPPMFANGHYVLTDDSLFCYKMAYEGEYNDDTKQKTVRWDDPELGIDWPTKTPILSKRDANAVFID
jgi:dTDP-4-dehydrorhamnose 3,5-epimerase